MAWIREIATAARDVARGVSVDAEGDVYVAGSTEGSLDGSVASNNDPFLQKYSGEGDLTWTRQLRSTGNGFVSVDGWAYGVSLDPQGNAFIGGYTYVHPTIGDVDALAAKLTSDGDLIWQRRLDIDVTDYVFSSTIDARGNLVIVGATAGGPFAAGGFDASVLQLDSNGTVAWSSRFGTPQYESLTGVSADNDGNYYVVGTSRGDLAPPYSGVGSYSPIISKLNEDGAVVWTQQLRQFGYGVANGIAIDKMGNLYIAGSGGLSETTADAFVAKFDQSGNELWEYKTGGPFRDSASAIAVDEVGNVYFAGTVTNRVLPSIPTGPDGYVGKLNPQGNLVWMNFVETPGDDNAFGIAVDKKGGVYLAGDSNSNGFVAKFLDVPEPQGKALLAVTLISLGSVRQRR